jgi:hypothetical protein
MSRGVYRLGVGVVLVALAFLLAEWAATPPPGVTGANARRFREGMTLRRVEQLLGGRPGKWYPILVRLREDPRQGADVWYSGEWESGPVTVILDFDLAGQVERVAVFDDEPRPQSGPSPWSCLRSWFGW